MTLTGLLQHKIRYGNGSTKPELEYDPATCRFWPAVWRKQGYYTGMIGKWHLGPDFGHGRDWDWSVVWDRTVESNYGNYYEGQQVRVHGGELEDLGGYSTDRYTDWAVEFIEDGAARDKPWMLWLCYGAVHGPYTPAERHRGDYAESGEVPIPVDVFGPRADKPEHMVDLTMWKKGQDGLPYRSDRGLADWVKQYNEAVKAIDEGVGRLMEALEATGQLEDTVVIFTSDQGYAWGHHGFKLKVAPYDATLLAPLIVSNPTRVAEGAVCDEPVTGLDIVKTMHTLAGVESEWELDGRDFSDLLTAPGKAWGAGPMLMNYNGSHYGPGVDTVVASPGFEKMVIHDTGVVAWLMLREGRYKYVRYVAKDYLEELYDLEADPDELVNLAVRRQYHGKLAELRALAVSEYLKKGAKYVSTLPEPRVEGR
jgi:arylsulfatase A-like enzyme